MQIYKINSNFQNFKENFLLDSSRRIEHGLSFGIFVKIHDIFGRYMSIWNDMRIISIYSLFVNRIWIGLFSCFLKSHIKFLIWIFFLSVIAYENYKTGEHTKLQLMYTLKTTTYDKELYVCFYLVPGQAIKLTQV